MACDEWCRRDYCILCVAVGEKVKDMFYVNRATTESRPEDPRVDRPNTAPGRAHAIRAEKRGTLPLSVRGRAAAL